VHVEHEILSARAKSFRYCGTVVTLRALACLEDLSLGQRFQVRFMLEEELTDHVVELPSVVHGHVIELRRGLRSVIHVPRYLISRPHVLITL